MHECIQMHLPSGPVYRTCYVGANLQVVIITSCHASLTYLLNLFDYYYLT